MNWQDLIIEYAGNNPEIEWLFDKTKQQGMSTYDPTLVERYLRENPNLDLFSGEVLNFNFPTNYSETLRRVKEK